MSAVLDACREALDLLDRPRGPYAITGYTRVFGGAIRKRVRGDRSHYEARRGSGPWRTFTTDREATEYATLPTVVLCGGEGT